MATVHRALEMGGSDNFQRPVALKRLLPHLAEDASFIKSFVREAKLASLLTHINIVQIYELGRVGTEYFISMEYIDGRDIRQVLRHARKVTGPPPIHVTVGLIMQLCDALDYAHTRIDETTGSPLGLVHRDVSPSNLLVTSSGHLKVIDFGIAKAQSAQLRTQTGRVKGKLAYMAPEAIAGGRELDARSDVWAVGVVLHELLTARPLFASKNEYQTLLKVQRGEVMAPSTFNQACPIELDLLVFKALERDPERRFAGAAELRVELDRIRQKYSLHTGYRDIAQWLEWAFSLETPTGGFAGNTNDPSSTRTPTPMPRSLRSKDDEEAIEMAWGGGVREAAGPIVLDEVPDVSGKFPRMVDPRSADPEDDDIPTPSPTHGGRPRTQPMRAHSPAPHSDSSPANAKVALSVDDLLDAPPDEAGAPLGGRLRDEADPDSGEGPAPATRSSARMSVSGIGRAPRTKPGLKPASAHQIAENVEKRPQLTIGAALVERRAPKRGWMLGGALLLVGGGGAALAWFATTHSGSSPSTKTEPAVATTTVDKNEPGTVKFQVEPADAVIQIDGSANSHTGSPWKVELTAGAHQIEIKKSGYKSWLTSFDLETHTTQVLHIVLEPLTNAEQATDAQLVLQTNPSGLEVMVDGQLLASRTPVKMALRIGAHTLAVRRDGQIVWKQSVDAQAASNYEYNPSFLTQQRAPSTYVGAANPAPQPAQPAPRPEPIDATVARPEPAITTTPTPMQVPSPAPTPTGSAQEPAQHVAAQVPTPAPAPVPTPPPSTVTPNTKPVMVAPNAVTRVSGDVPDSVRATQNLPASAVAKLCIDTSGSVTSVDFISKLEPIVVNTLTGPMHRWRYQPYRKGGTLTPACFTVTLHLKN